MAEIKNRRLFRPFGPSIGKTFIPDDIVKKINKYVDDLIKDDARSKKQDVGANLAGNVKQEFDLDAKFANECGWLKFLSAECGLWIKESTGKKIKKFNLIGTWIVRQFQNEYNPIHYHGGHVSGVGYLKVPKTLGNPIQKESKTENSNGHLELIHGSRMFLSNSSIKFKPEVGNFYFFPNYMMHAVYPFTGSDEERRSISFNANIDNIIYDVYKNN